MAMTAWLAKLVIRSTCLSVSRLDFLTVDVDGADHLALLQHRHGQESPGTGKLDHCDRRPDRGRDIPASSSCRQIAPVLLGRMRAIAVIGSGEITGLRRRISAYSLERHRATVRKLSPSQSKRDRRTWPRRCGVAFANIASNTGSTSPGELEMMPSTSAVAAAAPAPRRARARALRASFPASTRTRACGRCAFSASRRSNA